MTGIALAVALGSAGIVAVGTPAAYAVTPSDEVAKLPISSFGAMVVDSAHERVYVTDGRKGSGASEVLVYNFQGQKVSSLATDQPVSGMALSADGATLHVSQSNRMLTFDTATQTRTGASFTPYDVTCGRDVAVAGGKTWFTETPYTDGYCDRPDNIAMLYGVSGTTFDDTGWNSQGRLRLEAGPEAPDRLVMGQAGAAEGANPFLTTFDASGENLVRGPSRRFADAEGKGALDLKDIAQSADGKRIAVADAAYGTRLLDAGDLADAPAGYQPLPDGAKASAVAFSGDGEYVARGAVASGSTADLLIQPADPADGTAPMEFAFEGALDGTRIVPQGLGWAKDGSRLFAVASDGGGNHWLHVIQPPAAQYDSRFTGALTTTPTQAVVGEPLGIRGKLELDGPAPAEPVKVTAVREDADGTQEVAAAKVAADGSFTVLDVPDRVGEATYTLRFLGDVTHRPAEDVTLTLDVAKAPTSIALTAPAEATREGGVEITGKLTGQGRALPSGISLKVTRTDRFGATGELTSAPVAADGTFRIKDLPSKRGRTVYAVSYEGDALHSGSSAEATVRVIS
ncbi:Ig-like domain repeat protein [Streptomyces sp. MZ04]|uniref:Ig-like domain repeat protein n=1 Tax=Streptomyces sp. MZ04 TaxID=2559236 RepID=UPI00107EC9F2|nr:Ig-like domain repeat protein [Streptomyces sp. MZ04]TGB02526.1 Ig-like domain repeat protein [Streptomyces sp. MZ04]